MEKLIEAGRTRWLAPFAVMALALALRLHGLRSGLPAINDPDELMFQLGALKMLSGKTLNPGWFGHPALITFRRSRRASRGGESAGGTTSSREVR